MSAEITIRFKLGEYFTPGSHKLAISMPELVQQTNQFSTKNRSPEGYPPCQPKLIGSNPRELFLHYNVKCFLPKSDPAGHDVKVHFDLSKVSDEATAKNLDVSCSCSCPAFLYWGAQWNLHQRDALEGEPRPILTAPTERLDLRNKFLICKHCKAVFERILPSVQHNITNIIRKRNVEQYRQRQKEREEAKEQPVTPATPEPKKSPAPAAPPTPAPEPNVVKRDTPATPKERKKIPVLDEDVIEAPTSGVTPAPPPPQLTPSKPSSAVAPPQETPNEASPAVAPLPPSKEKKLPPTPSAPKHLPRFTPQDRDMMRRMQKEEMKRRQRETQQRLKNNPGYRR